MKQTEPKQKHHYLTQCPESPNTAPTLLSLCSPQNWLFGVPPTTNPPTEAFLWPRLALTLHMLLQFCSCSLMPCPLCFVFSAGCHWRVPKRLMSPCNFCLPSASQPCSQYHSFKAVTWGVTGDLASWEPSLQVVCPGEKSHAMGRRWAELGYCPAPCPWARGDMASTCDAAVSI